MTNRANVYLTPGRLAEVATRVANAFRTLAAQNVERVVIPVRCRPHGALVEPDWSRHECGLCPPLVKRPLCFTASACELLAHAMLTDEAGGRPDWVPAKQTAWTASQCQRIHSAALAKLVAIGFVNDDGWPVPRELLNLIAERRSA